MFPLQQGDELCFKISPNPHQQQKISQDLILAQYGVVHDSSDATNNMRKGRRRNLISMGNNLDHDQVARGNNKGNNNNKVLHRDIERQRRQEMAALYASLRALLPLESIKGKRSISDHVNLAEDYIKHLQKNIKELSAKRDGLKKLPNSSVVASPSGSSNRFSPSSVTVRQSSGGFEIVFDSDLLGQDLPLSRVLKVLLEEGLSVVNCVSTKVNETLFHTVQTEVSDPTCLNLSKLQQILTSLDPSSETFDENAPKDFGKV